MSLYRQFTKGHPPFLTSYLTDIFCQMHRGWCLNEARKVIWRTADDLSWKETLLWRYSSGTAALIKCFDTPNKSSVFYCD